MNADQYRALIDATLRHALATCAFTPPEDGSISVAVALPALAERFGVAMRDDVRAAIDAHWARATPTARFVDGQGHARPPYALLSLRALSHADFAEDDQRAARMKLAIQVHTANLVQAFGAGSSATTSSEIDAAMTKEALVASAFAALLVGGGVAERFFERLAAMQRPDATFLPSTARDNPEPLWYDELALLHALSTFARGRGDARLDAVVARSVAYHAAEVQPDHASSHPWAIAAFLAHPEGLQLADMMLHAAGVQQPATMDAVSLLLLADAVD